jgi:hypothetical protein
MNYGPGTVQPGTEVWDVLEGRAINRVLSVDTDTNEVVVASLDEKGNIFLRGDQFASEAIKFQAIYPWPLTGKPRLFNCYYGQAA